MIRLVALTALLCGLAYGSEVPETGIVSCECMRKRRAADATPFFAYFCHSSNDISDIPPQPQECSEWSCLVSSTVNNCADGDVKIFPPKKWPSIADHQKLIKSDKKNRALAMQFEELKLLQAAEKMEQFAQRLAQWETKHDQREKCHQAVNKLAPVSYYVYKVVTQDVHLWSANNNRGLDIEFAKNDLVDMLSDRDFVSSTHTYEVPECDSTIVAKFSSPVTRVEEAAGAESIHISSTMKHGVKGYAAPNSNYRKGNDNVAGWIILKVVPGADSPTAILQNPLRKKPENDMIMNVAESGEPFYFDETAHNLVWATALTRDSDTDPSKMPRLVEMPICKEGKSHDCADLGELIGKTEQAQALKPEEVVIDTPTKDKADADKQVEEFVREVMNKIVPDLEDLPKPPEDPIRTRERVFIYGENETSAKRATERDAAARTALEKARKKHGRAPLRPRKSAD